MEQLMALYPTHNWRKTEKNNKIKVQKPWYEKISGVRLRKWIYSVDYWTQRGCLTWKLQDKRHEIQWKTDTFLQILVLIRNIYFFSLIKFANISSLKYNCIKFRISTWLRRYSDSLNAAVNFLLFRRLLIRIMEDVLYIGWEFYWFSSEIPSNIEKHTILKVGHAVGPLVEAPLYKSEGRGFDSLWGHWDFLLA
jgi:hypothetical protein